MNNIKTHRTILQLKKKYVIFSSNYDDIQRYRVEWTTDANFGTNDIRTLHTTLTSNSKVSGYFRLQYDTRLCVLHWPLQLYQYEFKLAHEPMVKFLISMVIMFTLFPIATIGIGYCNKSRVSFRAAMRSGTLSLCLLSILMSTVLIIGTIESDNNEKKKCIL